MKLDLAELWNKYQDEFLKFDRIENPIYPRPDMCAFLMLDKIVPPRDRAIGWKFGMVASADYDEIWLDVDMETLAELASEEQIRDLIRCGIRYDEDVESLAMFV